jgi:putative NADH-flavin reductase
MKERTMTRVAVLGATGSLGSRVARQALDAGHAVSLLVRMPSKLAAEVASRAAVSTGDIMQMPTSQLAHFIADHDALVGCAGMVTEGARFVELFDRVVTATELLPANRRPPVCWFLAGAGLLDLDESGRCGIDLPKVGGTYWPHRANFERLQRSQIGWRLLCPGPMVQGSAIGLPRLRVSIDALPAPLPGWTRYLPDALVLPFFAARIPQMIIPFADAAAFMLAHLDASEPFTRRRIGLALPEGMKGRKEHWAAPPHES